jgi:hypothetical protein
MQKQYKLPEEVAANIALCYQKLSAAQQFARAAFLHPNCPPPVKTDLTSVSASVTNIVERIDKRIPKQHWKLFKEQIKENDSLKLEEINRLFYLLSPQQQDVLETIASEMSKGHPIHFGGDDREVY